MISIDINLGGGYQVHIGAGLRQSPQLLDALRPLGNRFAIISDDNVGQLYGQDLLRFLSNAGLACDMFVFSEGEQHKTRETKAALEDRMLDAGMGRDICAIGIGGGVVTDLTGFLAATYCRGVPAVYLPTTTLALVDASIGGKTGVNTPLGKNMIGVIKHPAAVFADTETLSSLPDADFAGGLIEAIKHTLITDRDEFERIKSMSAKLLARDADALVETLESSSEIKRDVVLEDEHETGKRELLNLGHTVAHAIESSSDYRIPHGAAVALGIIAEAKMAEAEGLLPAADVGEIEEAIAPYVPHMDTNISTIDVAAVRNAMTLDKKSLKQAARFVLLEKIGKPHVAGERPATTVSDTAMKAGLQHIFREFG